QSGMFLRDPFATRFEYTDFFHLATALGGTPKKALFIGLGGGSAPKAFWRDYPQLQIDVAEIDPEVIRVARKYFEVPDDPRLRLHAADGRLFLEGSRERYDLIVLDAFFADAVPFHLTTREFFALAAEHLQPDGVLAINAISAVEGPRSRFYRSLDRTLQERFPNRYTFPVWLGDRDPGRLRNLILLATRSRRVAVPDLIRSAATLGDRVHVAQLRDYAAGIWTAEVKTDDVPILTDDHAPVDDLLKLEGLQ
ncbi:MAG: fused MFS/spermidine synthase, partial [Firmicutes bacterium]|nr:fused MFS/spermidine synthase [Bacillota bacterium]